MKKIYPQQNFRQMADIDILIEIDKAGSAKKVMETLGYQTEGFEKIHHDNYKSPPFVTVELHRYLLPKENKSFIYYEDIWDRAIKNEKMQNYYQLKNEDFYIYMIVHFSKHYYGCGAGLRFVMDIYVFLKKYSKELEWRYIRQELTDLHLSEFEQNVRLLADVWFENTKENFEAWKEVAIMEKEILLAGIYGTRGQYIKNQIRDYEKQGNSRGTAKLKYVLGRVFLPEKRLENQYSILKKYKCLYIICSLHRLLIGILKKRNLIKYEWKEVRNIGTNEK